MTIKSFLRKENIKYKSIEQYTIALNHMSFSHESKGNDESYERLEFLGDSILGQIVALYIFNNFKELTPGDMTILKSNVVNKSFLSAVSRKLDLQYIVKVGQGENLNQLSDSVFEDLFESLVGAIYLDAGYDETRKFVHKYICSSFNTIANKPDKIESMKDFKTKLQELLQSEKRKSVSYNLLKQKRVNGVMEFEVEAVFEENILGRGRGLSKKIAEQEAAREAYLRITK